MDAPPIDLVLFDLGGVLIDFGGVKSMKVLAGMESDDELWERWLTCRWVRSFERGHCSPDEFAAGMVEDWGLELTADQYLDEFSGWIGGVFPGAPELVAEVRQMVPTGCLSNTNSIHWDAHFSEWPLLSAFDHRFLSFEVGAVKPDTELFQFVADTIDAKPDRTLFLDDNALNVDAAAEFGFQAVRVKGPDEARRALVEVGLLRP